MSLWLTRDRFGYDLFSGSRPTFQSSALWIHEEDSCTIVAELIDPDIATIAGFPKLAVGEEGIIELESIDFKAKL